MAKRKSAAKKSESNGANLGFEAKLWLAADKLRSNMDAAEYKHVVLANGRMSSNQSGEGDIRRSIIEADLVDCMVALPGQLFYSTQIPVCLWFLARDKSGRASVPASRMRDRRGETLFIDARKLGTMIDRVHRELSDADITRLADTYHAWRGEFVVPASAGPMKAKPPKGGTTNGYADIPGFCRSATKAEIAEHGYVLTPGRYVGAEAVEDDDEPFEEKMARLMEDLAGQFAESAKLEAAIKQNLANLGFSMKW